ncbi:MAG: 2-amino-4-hydroxy-6-hydroxymethyldihydropteridine diphosphokinase [Candidatus Omnitrophica bacterium]|nr:2-amino-4-hydroxy-6-hydroxymethyldihydropteridine diphosphokinase [Candidatus Omnitrophota bacterium]
MRNEETDLGDIVYIGVGSNLGDREATLESAVRAIGSLPRTETLRTSSWYENPAVGIEGGKDFLNGVVEIRTELAPRELLDHLLQIERDHGRERKPKSQSPGYQNRTLDLDILIYGDLNLKEDHLQIPHPKMWEREFVRVPLAELGVLPRQV